VVEGLHSKHIGPRFNPQYFEKNPSQNKTKQQQQKYSSSRKLIQGQILKLESSSLLKEIN
jgi:hypothetical protein